MRDYKKLEVWVLVMKNKDIDHKIFKEASKLWTYLNHKTSNLNLYECVLCVEVEYSDVFDLFRLANEKNKYLVRSKFETYDFFFDGYDCIDFRKRS